MKSIQEIPLNNSRIKDGIERYLTLIQKKYEDRIEEVILYGSVARSENNENSDVDLLIIGTEDSSEVELDIIGMSFDIFMETGVDISPKYRSRRQFDEYCSFSFLQNVIHDGVRIA
ncbi:nucleotidyltransferase domain-containing protein [Methanospirillum hungatei]|uniref:nucleotidyltransferase domain-containing protein n=1 Tax=Methanospirillum hungatei TaxID=2203 RepID=UPI0026F2C915|nr:nucleotidyltransferase domain-containing protein [Methanospirillum hungatei]MCA1916966.1 nucleotidyltransferase domain-containing protein [Methanospirillum hungatei]